MHTWGHMFHITVSYGTNSQYRDSGTRDVRVRVSSDA